MQDKNNNKFRFIH